MQGDVVFNADFFRFVAQLGVGGAIAGIVFFFYRKDVRSYTDLWQAAAAMNAKQTEAMMSLVERTTTAIVTNTEVVKSMHRRLDRLDILRVVGTGDEPSRDEP
jgi:hypothetical protein